MADTIVFLDDPFDGAAAQIAGRVPPGNTNGIAWDGANFALTGSGSASSTDTGSPAQGYAQYYFTTFSDQNINGAYVEFEYDFGVDATDSTLEFQYYFSGGEPIQAIFRLVMDASPSAHYVLEMEQDSGTAVQSDPFDYTVEPQTKGRITLDTDAMLARLSINGNEILTQPITGVSATPTWNAGSVTIIFGDQRAPNQRIWVYSAHAAVGDGAVDPPAEFTPIVLRDTFDGSAGLLPGRFPDIGKAAWSGHDIQLDGAGNLICTDVANIPRNGGAFYTFPCTSDILGAHFDVKFTYGVPYYYAMDTGTLEVHLNFTDASGDGYFTVVVELAVAGGEGGWANLAYSLEAGGTTFRGTAKNVPDDVLHTAHLQLDGATLLATLSIDGVDVLTAPIDITPAMWTSGEAWLLWTDPRANIADRIKVGFVEVGFTPDGSTGEVGYKTTTVALDTFTGAARLLGSHAMDKAPQGYGWDIDTDWTIDGDGNARGVGQVQCMDAGGDWLLPFLWDYGCTARIKFTPGAVDEQLMLMWGNTASGNYNTLSLWTGHSGDWGDGTGDLRFRGGYGAEMHSPLGTKFDAGMEYDVAVVTDFVADPDDDGYNSAITINGVELMRVTVPQVSAYGPKSILWINRGGDDPMNIAISEVELAQKDRDITDPPVVSLFWENFVGAVETP